MRSICKTIAITAAGLLLFSQFAQASDEAGSSLSSMLENTDVSGWVAASYNYNFEGLHNDDLDNSSPGNGNPGGVGQTHPNANSFQLDQVWISIDNAATEDSRGGVHIDYKWGVQNGGTMGDLHTAYVSYLAPIGEGVNLDVGLLPTMIGAEVQQTTQNFNITRGLVWGMQPVTNVGAVLSTDLGGGLGVAIGILNDPLSNSLNDDDNNKGITAQVSYATDDMSVAATLVWGGNDVEPDTISAGGIFGDNVGFLDILVACGGSGKTEAWFDYTLRWVDVGGFSEDYYQHGIAVAARTEVSDDLGIAVRAEGVFSRLAKTSGTFSNNLWSFTGTADYALTDNLTAKGEVRVDIDSDDGFHENEDVAGTIFAQLTYAF